MKDITVLLAEDHMIVREGFRKMQSDFEPDLEVVGECRRTAGRPSRWPPNFDPP